VRVAITGHSRVYYRKCIQTFQDMQSTIYCNATNKIRTWLQTKHYSVVMVVSFFLNANSENHIIGTKNVILRHKINLFLENRTVTS
jgi:hypothetical protein